MHHRHVLITGAGSGLGAATTVRFAQDYEYISICDIDGDALNRVASALAIAPDRLVTAQCDVSDERQLKAFVSAAGERFGRLDVLVNNAGVGLFGNIEALTSGAWRQHFAVNVDSVLFACQAAMPWLRVQGGCIVNTSSVCGLRGDPNLTAYNATKAAILNMTRAMAADFGPDGIRVNAVCPGMIRTTASTAMLANANLLQAYERMVPLGRVGDANEVANVTHFLASDAATYVSGVAIVIDGGMTAATRQPSVSEFL